MEFLKLNSRRSLRSPWSLCTKSSVKSDQHNYARMLIIMTILLCACARGFKVWVGRRWCFTNLYTIWLHGMRQHPGRENNSMACKTMGGDVLEVVCFCVCMHMQVWFPWGSTWMCFLEGLFLCARVFVCACMGISFIYGGSFVGGIILQLQQFRYPFCSVTIFKHGRLFWWVTGVNLLGFQCTLFYYGRI